MRSKTAYFQFFTISIVGLLFFFLYLYSNFDSGYEIDDSSAIFGGQDEFGYLSAGYLVSYESSNSIRTCGVTYLNQNTALTAAHCVENGNNFWVGTGEFSYIEEDNAAVQEVIIHPQWDGQDRAYDIALVRFAPRENVQTSDFGNIEVGCGYRIVGYGSTEIDDILDPGVRLRKSYELCIDAFTQNNLYISGETGGVCFGDSGSPIYNERTGEVVGVLSAVFPLPGTTDQYCDIGNNALAVRTDEFEGYIAQFTNQSVLASNVQCGSPCTQTNQCAEGLSCNAGQCITPSGTCESAVGDFCAVTASVSCIDSASCVDNRCVQKTVVTTQAAEDQVLQLETSTADFFEEYRDIVVGAVAFVLGVNVLLILRLTILRPKQRYY